MPMVWPSGGALATISVPITPPAPDRLPAITDWPSAAASFAPTARDSRSVVPPTANGTMMRIGLVGYCAEAGIAVAANETASASAHRRFPIPDLPAGTAFAAVGFIASPPSAQARAWSLALDAELLDERWPALQLSLQERIKVLG